jgi:diguanylate cyclase (GGDEF)-like protein/PAS domain S-box-containing protein
VLIENTVDVLVLADARFQRLYVSPSALDVMGYSSEELVGWTPEGLLHPDDCDRVMAVLGSLDAQKPTATAEWRMRRRDGTYRWMETTYRRLPDGRFVCVVRDIQRRKELEAELQSALRQVERLAMCDALTDLPNRRSFFDAVQRRLTDASGEGRCAVLLVDLDRFKPVNDLYGHTVGDKVLVEMGRRLKDVAGPDGFVARLGGDEFAVLLVGGDRAQVQRTADDIRESLCAPMHIGSLNLALGASVGFAISPEDGGDTVALLKCADAAMYCAKHERHGGRRAYR